jgi:hypothetical protein
VRGAVPPAKSLRTPSTDWSRADARGRTYSHSSARGRPTTSSDPSIDQVRPAKGPGAESSRRGRAARSSRTTSSSLAPSAPGWRAITASRSPPGATAEPPAVSPAGSGTTRSRRPRGPWIAIVLEETVTSRRPSRAHQISSGGGPTGVEPSWRPVSTSTIRTR